mmetsp:Transcript_17090/g.42432  ORF Transcript_17090/g.42432 Transcript_17090/m.42432 type:complete len:240 (+) Transcript_17090:68-787(+)
MLCLWPMRCCTDDRAQSTDDERCSPAPVTWASPSKCILLQLLIGTDAEVIGLPLQRHEEVGRLCERLLRRLEVLVVGDLDPEQLAKVVGGVRHRARHLVTQLRQQRRRLVARAVGRGERLAHHLRRRHLRGVCMPLRPRLARLGEPPRLLQPLLLLGEPREQRLQHRALQRAQCRGSPRELIDETKRPPQSLERARHHARLVPVAPQHHERAVRLLLDGEQRAVLERGRRRHRLRKELR